MAFTSSCPEYDAADEEIITKVLAGKVELFEIIVRRHTPRLLRLAISVLHNSADAEEIVQDAYVSAYQYLHQFAGRAKFATWLMRIAYHKSLARVRSRSREVRLDHEEGPEPSWLIHRGPTPEQTVSAAETATLLARMIESLPAAYRSVLVLRDLQEVDTDAAARELRISRTNAKVRLHRARAMLRREYERALMPATQDGIPPGIAVAADTSTGAPC